VERQVLGIALVVGLAVLIIAGVVLIRYNAPDRRIRRERRRETAAYRKRMAERAGSQGSGGRAGREDEMSR
jgi:hypothetical protein